MASNSILFTAYYIIFSLFLFLHFPSPSLATDSSASIPTSPDTACQSTPFPRYCKAVLPNNRSSIHDYGRFSLHRAFETTKSFLTLIDIHLKMSYPQTTLKAFQDCQDLINRNLEFLKSSIESVDSTDTLPTTQAEDTHTWLSAILTNQQTCSDGLQATSSASRLQITLLNPFNNGNMLYSVSLALFRHGWGGATRNGRWLTQKRKTLQMSWGNVNVSQMVVVNQNGSGNFTTIGDALAAAPNNSKSSSGYFVIYVKAGVYQEYVSIASNQKYLMMIGDGINQTVITGNHSVADNWTTYSSATFAVSGQGFVAANLTISNTAGAAKFQAVALRNDADLSTFYNCSFEGYQDTLYTHTMRQFYRNCDIYGTIDFIFGNAAVVFQNCNVYPRLPLLGQFNTVTAQGRTDINQNTGTSIQNCTVTAAPDLASSNVTVNTYLGRPWKLYSRTVCMQSFLDSLINPAGWAAWSGDFALNTSYYAEYQNIGPGSNTSNRVTWPGFHLINATDAANFTVSNFIMGNIWLPATGVPFVAGLM